VPCSNNVMACGKIRKREMALVIGDGKMSGFQDNEITLHPGMNIALDGNEFLVVIGIGKRRGARQLHFVPFAIDTGERMDVVREGVAVGDGDFLANAEGEDVGGIVAVLLVKDGSWTGSWGIVVVAGRNVDDDVAKGVAGTGDDVVRIQRIGGVQANAFRLLGKIKRFVFGGSAGKRDFAGDGATGRSGCVKRNRKTRQRQQAHFSYVHRSSFPKLSEGFQVVMGLKTGRGHEKKQARRAQEPPAGTVTTNSTGDTEERTRENQRSHPKKQWPFGEVQKGLQKKLAERVGPRRRRAPSWSRE